MGGEGEEVRIERRIGRKGYERIDEGEDCSISLDKSVEVLCFEMCHVEK